MEKLPIWGTVKGSFSFVLGHLGDMLKLSAVSMILYALLAYAEYKLFATQEASFSEEIIRGLLMSFATLCVLVPFATSWHRRYLIAGNSPNWFSFQFGAKERRYFMYSLVATAVFSLAMMPLINIEEVSEGSAVLWRLFTFLVGFGVSFYFFIRLAMIFPAAALGAQAGLKDSWRATAGSSWRVFFIYSLLTLIAFVIAVCFLIILLIGISFTNFGGPEAGIAELTGLFVLFFIPVEIFITALSTSCLSIIYRHLSQQDDQVSLTHEEIGEGA